MKKLLKAIAFATTALGGLTPSQAQVQPNFAGSTVSMDFEVTNGLKTFNTARFRPSLSLHLKNMRPGPLLDDEQVLTIGNEALLPNSLELSMSKQSRRSGSSARREARENFMLGFGLQRGGVTSVETFANGTQRTSQMVIHNAYIYSTMTLVDIPFKAKHGKLVGSFRLHTGPMFSLGPFEKSASLIGKARLAAGYEVGGKKNPWILGISATATGLFSHVAYKGAMGEHSKENTAESAATAALLLQIPLNFK